MLRQEILRNSVQWEAVVPSSPVEFEEVFQCRVHGHIILDTRTGLFQLFLGAHSRKTLQRFVAQPRAPRSKAWQPRRRIILFSTRLSDETSWIMGSEDKKRCMWKRRVWETAGYMGRRIASRKKQATLIGSGVEVRNAMCVPPNVKGDAVYWTAVTCRVL